MGAVYCALVHHPVLDRMGEEVATSITNLDVHDLARSARTYGLRGYFVVSPIEAQHPVVRKIIDHWSTGAGRQRSPERSEAIALVEVCRSVDDAIGEITRRDGLPPRLVATSARHGLGRVPYAVEAQRIETEPQPVLILFGTGHGLSDRVLGRADAILAPVQGPGDYNHLSVRSAAAITLDRLLGRRGEGDDPI